MDAFKTLSAITVIFQHLNTFENTRWILTATEKIVGEIDSPLILFAIDQ